MERTYWGLQRMIKYKKVPNNENAIEIDGKIVLSFDPRYKEYSKWKNENPDLEQQLVDELEQKVENRRLYNDGGAHKGSGFSKWYNENGKLILISEMDGDKKDGEETSYYDDGQKKSEANYKNGFLEGLLVSWEGTGKKKSEIMYRGGKKEGKGIFYHKSGNKRWEGYYKNDVIDGELILYNESKIIISKENYRGGVLEGKYEYYYPENGNLRQSGCIKDSFKDGEVLSYYESGISKSIETYMLGIRTGPQKYFYPDGTVSQEGVSKDNLRIGVWYWYWTNGTKLKKEQYVNKTLYKISEWQDDGTEISIKKYNNELLHGKSVFYHYNGSISSVKTYENGKLHGEYIDYFVSGKKRSKGKMYYDQMEGEWTFWYHNEKKELECEFDFGSLIGISKIYHDNGSLKEEVM